MMNNKPETSTDKPVTPLMVRGGLALLILLGWLVTTAHGQSQSKNAIASPPIHATHVLGFADVKRNVSGDLSIDDNDLRFQRNESPAAQVAITSIQKISLGEQDRQVGGVPMMLGKAAVPYAGGRVISLFSHKKYESLTLEYRDSSGGLHGAIFRLAKGQAHTFKDALIAHGAHVTGTEDPAPAQSTLQESLEAEKWSVQVERVDPGVTTLDQSFSDAIYENLLRELPKSKQFKDVFRSGDRNANDVSGLLVLKTVVEKYSPGSETRRAVTTVTGATRVRVHIQLLTPNGHVLLEHSIEGDVRFIGDNLKATNKVAKNTAKILKRSTLPAAGGPVLQQTATKEQ